MPENTEMDPASETLEDQEKQETSQSDEETEGGKDEKSDPDNVEKTAEDRLREALRKERELRKAAERERDRKSRSEAERLADMERELASMRAERARDNALDRLARELGEDGYEFNRSDVLELLEDVSLTEENAEAAVRRRVDKLKRKVSVTTPDNTTKAMSEGKVEVGLKNPYAAFNSR